MWRAGSVVAGTVFSVMVLSACSTPPQQNPAEPGPSGGEYSDDLRVVDRGVQEGRSKHAGWPAPASYQVDPAFRSPWPEDVTRQQVIDTALAKTFAYFDDRVLDADPDNLTVTFEDTFPEHHHSWVTEMARVSAQFPTDYTDHDYHLFVGEPSWVKRVMFEEGFATAPGGMCDGLSADGAVGGCASGGIVTANYGLTVESGELDWSGSLPSIVAHEMFHSVQDVLDPAPLGEIPPIGDPLHRPVWFWEGGAEFIGYAVGDYAGVASYYVSPWEWWYYLPNPDLGLQSFSERPLFDTPPEEYWMGQMAAEYIVASVGIEGLLGISEGLSEGLTWEAAFESGTGLDLSEFYTRFDRAYQSMFAANKDLKTYLDRECPGQWNCDVQRGSAEFKRIESALVAASDAREQAGVEDFAEDYCESEWWMCAATEVVLPPEAENSAHGRPVDDPERIGPPSCDALAEVAEITDGIAASFDYRDSAGTPNTMVSTQWYARLAQLDTNSDGVVCGQGDTG